MAPPLGRERNGERPTANGDVRKPRAHCPTLWVCYRFCRFGARGRVVDRDELEERCFELLSEGQFRETARLVCDFEGRQNSPRGLNVQWNSPQYRASFEEDMQAISEMKPAILGELSDDQWRTLRIRAGMMEASGSNRVPRRFSLPRFKIGAMDEDAAARMIVFSVAEGRNRREWSKLRIQRVEISVAEDSCAACRALQGETFAIAGAPEIPHPGCTHAMGCRCATAPLFEEEIQCTEANEPPRRSRVWLILLAVGIAIVLSWLARR